ncbi:unnamed protein product [Sphagnum jensenii]|uniref:Uncharacterized protein n=1 Tax=Sphagnum jensenii TaxID=128206 RepID=A0ABP0W3X2_9BRYO
MAAPSPGEVAAAAADATPSLSSLPTQSPPSLTTSSSSHESVWTKEQDKQFENALDIHDQDSPKRWENIAAMVPGKDATEVKRHFEILQEDVSLIDAGRIALPNYSPSSLSTSSEEATAAAGGGKGVGSSKSADQERRKGIPWSEEEHRLFLLGLAKFGKGDWRSISRNFVISRTPTQVASHAQKYFLRLNSINKDKRRSSIHDITSVNNGDTMQQGQQGPITGQPALVPIPGQPVQQPTGVYPGGQAPAVGAPVMLPPPGHVPFGARGHLPRPGMQGPPMPFSHMAYPMTQPSMHH